MKHAEESFAERVRRVVARVPRGRVATYGAVAALAGSPGAARAVGSVLRALGSDSDLPWWRVVGAGGRITTSRVRRTAQIQRAALENEGVGFDGSGRIRMERHEWEPGAESD